MVRECEKPGDGRCQVSSLFAGEKNPKLTALKIKDVRLVYAPPLGIGNFGDEQDSRMWPRHTGDFGYSTRVTRSGLRYACPDRLVLLS